VVDGIGEEIIGRLEQMHEAGISSSGILSFFAEHGIKFSEATLRKYVQLGLLPRSVRVGRKGKHQGSQGLYPVSVVRRILRIKEMMADDLTIEQIQSEFLFVRGDVEELDRLLDKIFETLDSAVRDRERAVAGIGLGHELAGARRLAKDLLQKIETLESRLTARARIARQAAS
jgi:hypothetical protein